jgi:uncharacterized membrane protein
MSGGLRSFAPIAAVLLAIRFQFLSLDGTMFSFLNRPFILVAGVTLSLGEFVGDKLPFAPNRTAWLSVTARVFSGALSGSVIMAAVSGNSTMALVAGAALGIVGALAGTFAGFFGRKAIVKGLRMNDAYVALGEDLLSLALAVFGIYLIA